jgi:hypothetical protein
MRRHEISAELTNPKQAAIEQLLVRDHAPHPVSSWAVRTHPRHHVVGVGIGRKIKRGRTGPIVTCPEIPVSLRGLSAVSAICCLRPSVLSRSKSVLASAARSANALASAASMAMERIINLLEFAFAHPRNTCLTFSYRFSGWARDQSNMK